MHRNYFGFGVHCHQPVGNFEEVFEESYRKSYLPFFEELKNFPEIQINVHISGSLLEWLMENKKEFMEMISDFISSGQIEILGGAKYEAILPLLTETDITEQIIEYTKFLSEKLNVYPRGMWLPERVWEQYLAKPIAMAGIEYTLVDDYHFNHAGWLNDRLYGYFMTEHEGFKIKLIPIIETLRYKIPYADAEEVVEYIIENVESAGGGLTVMMDDIEKFGLWPKSYEHVYRKKWLNRFFSKISEEQKKGRLKAVKFSDYLDKFHSEGNIYLPSDSYSEMGKWSLPYDSSLVFAPILAEVKKTKEEEKKDWMKFIRGGFFRNMLVKYPEANLMHKKMMRLSRQINDFRNHKNFPQMRDHLFRGQCNCPYWHGIFGGIYHSHLRAATFSELLKCEKILLQTSGEEIVIDEDDMVFYGQKEIEVCTENFCLHLHPMLGGNASEFSEFKTCHNVGFVVKRRPEVYHKNIATTPIAADDAGAKSLHEIIEMKDSDLEDKILYDWYDRHSFIFHFFHPSTKLYNFSQSRYGEQGDFVNQPFETDIDKNAKKIVMRREGHVWSADKFLPVAVTKIFDFSRGLKFFWKVENISNEDIPALPGIEFNLTGSSEKSAFFSVGGRKYRAVDPVETAGNRILFEETYWKLKLVLTSSLETEIWAYPVNTVCRLDGGIESLFQGVSITFLKRINLAAHGSIQGFIEVSQE